MWNARDDRRQSEATSIRTNCSSRISNLIRPGMLNCFVLWMVRLAPCIINAIRIQKRKNRKYAFTISRAKIWTCHRTAYLMFQFFIYLSKNSKPLFAQANVSARKWHSDLDMKCYYLY